MNLECCKKTLAWLKEHPSDNLSREHMIEYFEWLVPRVEELEGAIENHDLMIRIGGIAARYADEELYAHLDKPSTDIDKGQGSAT